MRKLLIIAFTLSAALFACTASTDDVLLITELTDGEQTSLCNAVVDDCLDPICDDPCVFNGCAQAVIDGDIDVECAGVFEDDGTLVDTCIIDALDANCP